MDWINFDTKKIKQFYTEYRNWVLKHPTKVTDLEAAVKYGSYLLAGRFRNSSLLCEIAYSGSRLFEMFNDFLIRGTFPSLSSNQYDRLSLLLTVVEYFEVLLEVAAVQIWGEAGRWAVVAIIQLLKSVWRLILLLKNKTILIGSPPLKAVNRKDAANDIKNINGDVLNGFISLSEKGVIQLPRSGRFMRTLNGAPPPHLRTFLPPSISSGNYLKKVTQKNISMNLFVAEFLHICRPISHLASMYLFGVKSWVPWSLAFGIDLTSLHMYKGSVLTKEERQELAYRRLNLLMYLIRSPAFHFVTRKRINQFLIAAGNNIPLAQYICNPLLEYIPDWQKIYAYTWS